MAGTMAARGEELVDQLREKYGGDLYRASIWEIRHALAALHSNHHQHKMLGEVLDRKTRDRQHGLLEEPAPVALQPPTTWPESGTASATLPGLNVPE